MNAADVVALASGLPGTVAHAHHVWSALTVDEKGFCWISHPDEVAMVKTTSSAWVIVELLCVDDGEFAELLTEGWRLNARAADIAAYDTKHGLVTPPDLTR